MDRRLISRLGRHVRRPPRGISGAWLFALGIALVLAIQPLWPDRTAIGITGAIALTMIAAARWQLRWSPAIVLVLCAITVRLAMWGIHSSDVSDVTSIAVPPVVARRRSRCRTDRRRRAP